ncbi:hypothetical protein Leryth_011036 [Lithospermum erythrorhizon]|nr:hypothetical protein Leryth_011036 [Lithospermum erythrorhizon]
MLARHYIISPLMITATAYLDKATYLLVDETEEIAWKYTSSYIFDVISTHTFEPCQKAPTADL